MKKGHVFSTVGHFTERVRGKTVVKHQHSSLEPVVVFDAGRQKSQKWNIASRLCSQMDEVTVNSREVLQHTIYVPSPYATLTQYYTKKSWDNSVSNVLKTGWKSIGLRFPAWAEIFLFFYCVETGLVPAQGFE
jgi:hypothetical protein